MTSGEATADEKCCYFGIIHYDVHLELHREECQYVTKYIFYKPGFQRPWSFNGQSEQPCISSSKLLTKIT